MVIKINNMNKSWSTIIVYILCKYIIYSMLINIFNSFKAPIVGIRD